MKIEASPEDVANLLNQYKTTIKSNPETGELVYDDIPVIFARADFILADDQKAYALEANTIPGLTTHSLVPKAAAKAGLSMSELCVKIIEAAYSSLVSRDS